MINKKKFPFIIGAVLLVALITLVVFLIFRKAPSEVPTQGKQPPLWGEYHTNLPNSLILVDAQGRRTGKDPITGTLYREIPGTSYTEEMGSGELFASDLPNGRYTFYVIGGAIGPYWLDVSHYGQKDQLFRGNIESGSMIAYIQDYDPSDLANSLLSYRGAYSSTASITTEPPHNLPLPPLPK